MGNAVLGEPGQGLMQCDRVRGGQSPVAGNAATSLPQGCQGTPPSVPSGQRFCRAKSATEVLPLVP